MGLYLCVFDAAGTELDGVEVGFYADFDWFRTIVSLSMEASRGERFPILMMHSDCDGSWNAESCKALAIELETIRAECLQFEPVPLNSEWQSEIAAKLFLKMDSLLDCFFSVSGEPLLDRMLELCRVAIEGQYAIEFQ